jgi:hypothetical protein
MGVIINPRGTSGAGKTELARRIMALYGDVEPIHRAGRIRPIWYRLQHPRGGRPLAVLGHYEVTSGGCDTIGARDDVFQLASDCAVSGHDVLLEGLTISGEHERSTQLAQAHELHILHLSTPLDRCIRNVIARRRARRDTWPRISISAATEYKRIAQACSRLQHCTNVEALSFDEALRRAQALLGIDGVTKARPPET